MSLVLCTGLLALSSSGAVLVGIAREGLGLARDVPLLLMVVFVGGVVAALVGAAGLLESSAGVDLSG